MAAAVLVDRDGRFLLAQRPAGKVYAGYWEFPGGKVEPGESLVDALRRELREELGITVRTAYPWITRTYAYPHAQVRLHFFRVTGWEGEFHPHEGQAFEWQRPERLTVAPVLPANGPVLRFLALPCVYGITRAGELGVERFLERLDTALAGGLRLVQLREKGMDATALEAFGREVASRCRGVGAKLLVNGGIDLADRIGAHGVHLSAARLMTLASRPDIAFCAASCHDRRELDRAADLGADFVVLGPVHPTPDASRDADAGVGRLRTSGRGVPTSSVFPRRHRSRLPHRCLGVRRPRDRHDAGRLALRITVRSQCISPSFLSYC